MRAAGARSVVHVGGGWVGIAPAVLAGADAIGLDLGPWDERTWDQVARAVERGVDGGLEGVAYPGDGVAGGLADVGAGAEGEDGGGKEEQREAAGFHDRIVLCALGPRRQTEVQVELQCTTSLRFGAASGRQKRTKAVRRGNR